MGKFVPQEGNYLTVTLPGEILRAIVVKKINDNTVIVEIATEPLSKLSHSFRFRDIVVCKRVRGLFGEDWEAKQNGGASIDTLIEQEHEDAAKTRVVARKQKPKPKPVKKAVKKPAKKG